MASITVLSLTSATSHALLNVGKRITNVMIASMAFNMPLDSGGKSGLVVAAIGGCFYNDKISAALQKVIPRQRLKHHAMVLIFGSIVCVQSWMIFNLPTLKEDYEWIYP